MEWRNIDQFSHEDRTGRGQELRLGIRINASQAGRQDLPNCSDSSAFRQPEESQSLPSAKPPVDPDTVDLLQIRLVLGLTISEMGDLLDVTSPTIRRWQKRLQLKPDTMRYQRLVLLHEIATLGLQVYNDKGLKAYLRDPSAFDGTTALQLIKRGDGRQVVEDLTADYEGYGF